MPIHLRDLINWAVMLMDKMTVQQAINILSMQFPIKDFDSISLKSPDGTHWELTIGNDGRITVTKEV